MPFAAFSWATVAQDDAEIRDGNLKACVEARRASEVLSLARGKRKGKVECSFRMKESCTFAEREKKTHTQKRTFISVTNVQSELDSKQSLASFRLGNNMVRECEEKENLEKRV